MQYANQMTEKETTLIKYKKLFRLMDRDAKLKWVLPATQGPLLNQKNILPRKTLKTINALMRTEYPAYSTL